MFRSKTRSSEAQQALGLLRPMPGSLLARGGRLVGAPWSPVRCSPSRSSALISARPAFGDESSAREEEAERIADGAITSLREGAAADPSIIAEQVANLASPGPRFDFSMIRIHADGQAARSAKALNALAFTEDQDISFGAGQYAPGTPRCARLLAHEMVHAMQNQRSTLGRSFLHLKPAPGADQSDTEGELAKLALSEVELADLTTEIREQRTRTLSHEEVMLTGSTEHDVALLSERFFARAMQREPIEPYDRLILFPEAIREVPLLKAYKDKVIKPEYEALTKGEQSGMGKRAAQIEKLKLSAADKDQLWRFVKQGSFVTLSGKRQFLSGDPDLDGDTLAEHFFARAIAPELLEPGADPSLNLILVPYGVRGLHLFELYKRIIIRPELDKAWSDPELQALIKERSSLEVERARIREAIREDALNIGQGTRAFDVHERHLTEPLEENEPGPRPPLLRAIGALASASVTRQKKDPVRKKKGFGIASLMRPPEPKKTRQSRHASGTAVDISSYAGKLLHAEHPADALEGVLELIKDLPPGAYALGLPRGPRSPMDFENKLYAKFFVRPQEQTPAHPELNDLGMRVVRENPFEFRSSVPVNSKGSIAQLNNKDMQAKLTAAFDDAMKRGVTIVAIFPDGLDHVHLAADSAESLATKF